MLREILIKNSYYVNGYRKRLQTSLGFDERSWEMAVDYPRDVFTVRDLEVMAFVLEIPFDDLLSVIRLGEDNLSPEEVFLGKYAIKNIQRANEDSWRKNAAADKRSKVELITELEKKKEAIKTSSDSLIKSLLR
jgi:hypothetical protein